MCLPQTFWLIVFESQKKKIVSPCFRSFITLSKHFFLRNQEMLCFLCVLDACCKLPFIYFLTKILRVVPLAHLADMSRFTVVSCSTNIHTPPWQICPDLQLLAVVPTFKRQHGFLFNSQLAFLAKAEAFQQNIRIFCL